MKLTAEQIVYTHPGAREPLLNGISLEIAPGRISALLGRNGSGKSTLVRILSGYLKPDSGTVTLDGRPVSEWSAAERVRRLHGGSHRRILIPCALAGAAFLMLADVLGRVVSPVRELPVGMVTAAVGCPVFLWLLNRGRAGA